MKASNGKSFERNYASHLRHLKLKGLRPKTIDAYSRAVRRIGEHFDDRIDHLTEQQMADYFTELVASHSWSTVKLDLYGLKFYYAHVLRKPWVAPGLIKPPKTQRLPDIVTVAEAQRILSPPASSATGCSSSPCTAWACVSAKDCGCRSAISMRRAGACTSATPKATRIASFRCRKRPIRSCAVSGKSIATRCCCLRVGTAA